MSAIPPAMSVILVTDVFENIRRPFNHLAAQTIRDRLELVIVTPTNEALTFDSSKFASVRIIKVESIKSMPAARARGVREATAPIVAFVETHSFPAPEWAEALLERYSGGWSVVGPMVVNANPKSIISRANYALDYGRWSVPSAGGETDILPGHNSSYKRSILLSLGQKLDEVLEAEFALHWDLHAQGYRLYLEPRARILHLNITAPRSWIAERIHAGRLMAGIRSQNWSPARRMIYFAGAPLIPFVRLARLLRDSVRSHQEKKLDLIVAPALMVSLAVSAFGEMIGYGFGSGDALAAIFDMEIHREAHIAGYDKGEGNLASA